MSCSACGDANHTIRSCEDARAVPLMRRTAVQFRARGGKLWQDRAASVEKRAGALERRLAAAARRASDEAARGEGRAIDALATARRP